MIGNPPMKTNAIFLQPIANYRRDSQRHSAPLGQEGTPLEGWVAREIVRLYISSEWIRHSSRHEFVSWPFVP